MWKLKISGSSIMHNMGWRSFLKTMTSVTQSFTWLFQKQEFRTHLPEKEISELVRFLLNFTVHADDLRPKSFYNAKSYLDQKALVNNVLKRPFGTILRSNLHILTNCARLIGSIMEHMMWSKQWADLLPFSYRNASWKSTITVYMFQIKYILSHTWCIFKLNPCQ